MRVAIATSLTEQEGEEDTLKMLTNITIITKQMLLMFLWPLITGALFTDAQYSSSSSSLSSLSAQLNNFGYCDSSRLIRCQQDILRDLQQASFYSSSSSQISSGPPYSPKQPLIQQSSGNLVISNNNNNLTLCRYVRSNLDCVLSLTPACYDQSSVAHTSSDLILRAKRHLEQSGCNEPDTTWTNTFCYRSHEVRTCEERHGFTAYQPLVMTLNTTACLAYQAFRQCVDSYLRLSCKVHEMDMLNEYLIDRAADLSWRCPIHNLTSSNGAASLSSYTDPYRLSNGAVHQLVPSYVPSYGSGGSYSAHDQQQRIMPTYSGNGQSSSSSLNLFSGSGNIRGDQAWERFRTPLDEVRYGISRYPSSTGGGNGEVFDRLIAGELESSDCPVKAAPYARECEDTLLDQQRLARDSKDGNELQRRICCSLFQYRDCISRVVLDRCADSTQAAVELLMGVRRREMTLTCRSFNRDICSGSNTMALLNRSLLFVVAILASFMTFKQQRQSFVS